jgi:hypothetical protein
MSDDRETMYDTLRGAEQLLKTSGDATGLADAIITLIGIMAGPMCASPEQMIAVLLRSTWNRALEAGAEKAPNAIYAAEIRALKVPEDD